MKFHPASKKGQIMILTVLALGGTILGATTIAGLLMLYQIRQTTDLGNSTKAIYAADAGLEHAFYDTTCASDPDKSPCPLAPLTDLTNGAKVVIRCYTLEGDLIPEDAGGCSSGEARRIRSAGAAGESSRAFEAIF